MKSTITLPGMIDIHAHFRDPAETESEDFFTGTCSALAGGVVTVFDMPNTDPPVFTIKALEEKMSIAKGKAVSDFGLYFGSDGKNTDQFLKVANRVVGLKVFLNESTGNLTVSDDVSLETIFSSWPPSRVIVVHAEGEMIEKSIALAKTFGNKLHITHISTQKALTAIIEAKKNSMTVTCDVTPHHLFLSKEDMDRRGHMAVHPQLGESDDRDFLWNNLSAIDCIASDHAPHTKKEKQKGAAGFPGIETTLPLLFTAVKEGKMTTEDVVRLTYDGPTQIFSLPHDPTTYIDIDIDEKSTLKAESQYSKCNWTPYEGMTVYGKVRSVVIRGTLAYMDGTILVDPGFGKNIKE